MDKVSMSDLFSVRYQKNVLLSSLDSWWHHKLWDLLPSTSKAMANKEKKREGLKHKNLRRKELFRWNKKAIFIVFEGLSLDEK